MPPKRLMPMKLPMMGPRGADAHGVDPVAVAVQGQVEPVQRLEDLRQHRSGQHHGNGGHDGGGQDAAAHLISDEAGSEVAQEADGSRGQQDGRRAEEQEHDGAAAQRRQRPVGVLPLAAEQASSFVLPATCGVRGQGGAGDAQESGALGGVVVDGGRDCVAEACSAGGGLEFHRRRVGRLPEFGPFHLRGGSLAQPGEHLALVFTAALAARRQREAVDVAGDARREGQQHDGGNRDAEHRSDDPSDVSQLTQISKTHDVAPLSSEVMSLR